MQGPQPSDVDYDELSPAQMPFPDFAATYLHVRPKRGGVSPFVLNEAQLRLDREIEAIRAEGRPVRVLILKARQLGMSTYSLGKMYHYTTARVGVMSFLASFDDDSTVDLFERLRLMYDMAPDRPMTRTSNKTELDFSNPSRTLARVDPGLQSRIRLGTAGRTKLGRSKTLRYLHLSEVAFWPNAERVLLGLEQALPDDPDTIEIIESTANGIGGEFYKRWQRAVDPATRGDWRAIFFAWHEFADYAMPIEGGVMQPIPSSVQDRERFEAEERDLVVRFKLTPEQLNWRRWAIVNKCGNNLDLFKQEYPADADEAFLTTGRPIFDRNRLQYRLRQLQAADLRLEADRKPPRGYRGELHQDSGIVKFVPKPDGPLRIYELPRPESKYVIGGDAAKGASSTETDPDYAEWHVYDRYTWEQVAVYRERVEATDFARVGLRLGRFYLNAHLVPEANDHGHTVCVKLEEWGYPDLYIRQEFDDMGNPLAGKGKVGWETNRKTRPILVDAVDSAIRNNEVVLNDIPTIQQMLSFVRHPKTGKAQADEGCHDDGVMSTGLALAVMQHGPAMERVSKPRRKAVDEAEKDLHAESIARARDEYRALQVEQFQAEYDPTADAWEAQ